MRRLSLVALGLAGGCYPWVGGSWDDYWVPDEVQLVAVASQVEHVGGYWSDPSPYGDVWLGWLEEPRAGSSVMEIFAPLGPGCTRGEVDESAITDLLGDPGAEAVFLRGPVDVELAWDASKTRLWSPVDDLPVGSWDLEQVQGTSAGDLSVLGLFSMPKAVAITGPELGGAEAAVASLDDLAFSWNPAGGDADWVFIEVRLASGGSSGYQSFEWATCLVPFDQGEVSFASALWDDIERAELVYVFQGVLNEGFERVVGGDFSASTAGLRRELGVLRIE